MNQDVVDRRPIGEVFHDVMVEVLGIFSCGTATLRTTPLENTWTGAISRHRPTRLSLWMLSL